MAGFLGRLFGVTPEDVGKTIATPIDAIGNVFDKLFTSEEERAEAQRVLTALAMRPGELQVELNKIEAAHSSVFVAGWRPFIGWVAGISLGAYYIPQFAFASVMWVIASWGAGELVPYPVSEINGLTELVMAMLGLGALRTVDKALGTSK